MDVKVRHMGSVTVLDLSGEITIGQGDDLLRETLTELLETGRNNVLLNMKNISAVDSAGLGELVACYKRAREENGSVKVLNPSPSVHDLILLTQLDRLLELHDDESTALSTF